ncbi:MAG: sporulation protein YqfD [Eubacteriales bacterium]|nr:sporulation protein YqfD [Eubacteriales bacterium]
MRISDRMRGVVRLELFGALPSALLNAAAAGGIALWRAESVDENTLRLCCWEGQLDALRSLAERAGCEVRVLSRRGGSGNLRFARRRAALLTGLLLAALAVLASSLFVWQIEVRGARSLSRGEVLRALSDCGFEVGSFWPGTDTERLRSEMQLRCPEIAWLSVNVSGSRAVVLVAEREEKPLLPGEGKAAELVAARDALVRRVSILEGRAEVGPGQVVTKGQTLASGRLDSLANGSRAVRARGSVMAETWRELIAVRPAEETLKTPRSFGISRFALQFGKKRVNLYFGSGKALDGCDKIVAEYTLGVKGLFSTPLRLIRERIVPYDTRVGTDPDPVGMAERLASLLTLSAEGQILERSVSRAEARGLQTVTLRAHCIENIAQTREYD